MKDTTISYHRPASIKDGYFQSAAKGQEFVVDVTPSVREWATAIVSTSPD